MFNLRDKEKVLKEISQILFIGREIVYLHLAAVRKFVGAHNNFMMLHIMFNNQSMSTKHLKLTSRGEKVFLLILKGYSIEEISQELEMSRSGVRRHKENMLSANNCSSMYELIGKYYMQGD